MIQMNPTKTSESETITHSAGQVVRDIMTLVELQVKLFRNDVGDTAARFLRPAAIFMAGVLLLLATIPVCLLAIAQVLMAIGLPAVAAYTLVALISLIVAGAMAVWAWQRFRTMPPAFTRSREELAQNIAWIKYAVTNVTKKPQDSSGDLRNNRRS